jgi:hypothetical protein
MFDRTRRPLRLSGAYRFARFHDASALCDVG